MRGHIAPRLSTRRAERHAVRHSTFSQVRLGQSLLSSPVRYLKYWYQFDYQVNIQPVLPIPIQIPIILTYKGSFYGGEQCVMIYEMSHLPKILNLFNTFQQILNLEGQKQSIHPIALVFIQYQYQRIDGYMYPPTSTAFLFCSQTW